MKNIAHAFSRELVLQYLERWTEPSSSRRFELMAALMMQRLYEKKQWIGRVMIGYYINENYKQMLLKNETAINRDLLFDALKNGIDEHSAIDFTLVADGAESSIQEFQLKRFGMNKGEPQDTDALIRWL